MPDWGEVFRLTTSPVEIFVRGTVMFLVIFGLLRVAGKREGGGHSITDLLVVVLVAQAAAHGLSGDASGVSDSLLLVATILFWSVALDAIAYRWAPLRHLLKSRATPLIMECEIRKPSAAE